MSYFYDRANNINTQHQPFNYEHHYQQQHNIYNQQEELDNSKQHQPNIFYNKSSYDNSNVSISQDFDLCEIKDLFSNFQSVIFIE
jgi:hypothetical protein